MTYRKNQQEFITYDLFLDGTNIVFARFNPDGELNGEIIKKIPIGDLPNIKDKNTNVEQQSNNDLKGLDESERKLKMFSTQRTGIHIADGHKDASAGKKNAGPQFTKLVKDYNYAGFGDLATGVNKKCFLNSTRPKKFDKAFLDEAKANVLYNSKVINNCKSFSAFKTDDINDPKVIPPYFRKKINGIIIDAGLNLKDILKVHEYGTFGQIFDPAVSNKHAKIIPATFYPEQTEGEERNIKFCFHQKAMAILGINTGIIFTCSSDNENYDDLKNNTQIQVEYYEGSDFMTGSVGAPLSPPSPNEIIFNSTDGEKSSIYTVGMTGENYLFCNLRDPPGGNCTITGRPGDYNDNLKGNATKNDRILQTPLKEEFNKLVKSKYLGDFLQVLLTIFAKDIVDNTRPSMNGGAGEADEVSKDKKRGRQSGKMPPVPLDFKGSTSPNHAPGKKMKDDISAEPLNLESDIGSDEEVLDDPMANVAGEESDEEVPGAPRADGKPRQKHSTPAALLPSSAQEVGALLDAPAPTLTEQSKLNLVLSTGDQTVLFTSAHLKEPVVFTGTYATYEPVPNKVSNKFGVMLYNPAGVEVSYRDEKLSEIESIVTHRQERINQRIKTLEILIRESDLRIKIFDGNKEFMDKSLEFFEKLSQDYYDISVNINSSKNKIKRLFDNLPGVINFDGLPVDMKELIEEAFEEFKKEMNSYILTDIFKIVQTEKKKSNIILEELADKNKKSFSKVRITFKGTETQLYAGDEGLHHKRIANYDEDDRGEEHGSFINIKNRKHRTLWTYLKRTEIVPVPGGGGIEEQRGGMMDGDGDGEEDDEEDDAGPPQPSLTHVELTEGSKLFHSIVDTVPRFEGESNNDSIQIPLEDFKLIVNVSNNEELKDFFMDYENFLKNLGANLIVYGLGNYHDRMIIIEQESEVNELVTREEREVALNNLVNKYITICETGLDLPAVAPVAPVAPEVSDNAPFYPEENIGTFEPKIYGADNKEYTVTFTIDVLFKYLIIKQIEGINIGIGSLKLYHPYLIKYFANTQIDRLNNGLTLDEHSEGILEHVDSPFEDVINLAMIREIAQRVEDNFKRKSLIVGTTELPIGPGIQRFLKEEEEDIIDENNMPTTYFKQQIRQNCFSTLTRKELMLYDGTPEHIVRRIELMNYDVSTQKLELKQVRGIKNVYDYQLMNILFNKPTNISNWKLTVMSPEFIATVINTIEILDQSTIDNVGQTFYAMYQEEDKIKNLVADILIQLDVSILAHSNVSPVKSGATQSQPDSEHATMPMYSLASSQGDGNTETNIGDKIISSIDNIDTSVPDGSKIELALRERISIRKTAQGSGQGYGGGSKQNRKKSIKRKLKIKKKYTKKKK